MEAPPLERKLVAILAADIEGYSRLMHENEELALAILTSHRRIVDELIASAHGEISGTAGDSVLAEFASVVDAVRCAVAIQQALFRANRDNPETGMQFRIGINVGDVMVKDGGIFGDGVNVASRVEALAEPGGICVTRGVRDHVRDRVDYPFEDLGEHSVKNIARPVRVFRVLFDPEGSTNLYEKREADMPPAKPIKLEVSEEVTDPVEIAFWQSIQASDDPNEYRAYLEQYPAGSFASLAEARLVSSAEAPEQPDTDVELAYWDSVKDSANPAMLRAYLAKFPEGSFLELAQILLTDLEKEGAAGKG